MEAKKSTKSSRRTTSAVSFYCRPSKADRNGLAPIEVCIIINGKRTALSLPRREDPGKFKRDSVKRSSELYHYLAQTIARVNEIQTELLGEGTPVTVQNLKDYIQNGGRRTYTLEDLFGAYNGLLEKRIGVDLTTSSFKKYQRIEHAFMDHFGPEREASSIKNEDIAAFYAELNRTERMSTSASKMQKLKTIFRYAFENGHIPAFPFNGIKIRKGTPNIEYLTTEELNRIAGKDFGVERVNKVRDLFLFQACTGLSYSDLRALRKEDVQEYEGRYYIKKERVKTGIEYTTIIFEPGLSIWKRYGGHLPVLSNQRYNSYLKEIGSICGIEKDLHSHLARKTFATMMLSNPNIRLTTVSKMLGHSKVNTTQSYYAKVLDTSIFEETKNVKLR